MTKEMPLPMSDTVRTALITYQDYCKRQVNRAKLFQVKKIWNEELERVEAALSSLPKA